MRRRRGFTRLRWAWWRELFQQPDPPKVTPSQDDAAALERKRQNLEYSPSGGFIKDNKQRRIDE